jgi:ATP-dependent Clp protease ATP-binding subunit ClpC
MPRDIVEKFSSRLKNVLTRALCFVVEKNVQTIQPEHLLWALGTEKGSLGAEILKKVGIKQIELKKFVGAKASANETPIDQIESTSLNLSNEAKRIVEKAVLTANIYGHNYIGTEHMLSGIVQIDDKSTSDFFALQKTNMNELRDQIAIVLKSTSKFPEIQETLKKDGASLVEQTIKKETASLVNTETEETNGMPALEYFGRELTAKDTEILLDPVIGRELEIERLMEILCRRTKNNPLLLGEPGVGKTAIVEGLAKDIVANKVPPVLQNKRIFALDLALVLAGTMYRGEFEGRLRQIVDEIKKTDDIILFIDEIHTIVGAGAAAGSMDAANILKPALARGDIRCIGATTTAEFKKHIESDSALERRFQSINVEEPTEEKTIEILQGVAPYYEAFHNVKISHNAIEQAVKLSVRYQQNRNLPDKAIDLLDEASAAVRIRSQKPGPVERKKQLEKQVKEIRETKRQAVVEERFLDALNLKKQERAVMSNITTPTEPATENLTIITGAHIASVISRSTGIPLGSLLEEDHEYLENIEAHLEKHVLGQRNILKEVSGALKRAKTGVAHPSRPLASFLFLGPSGVGKTELAKAITKTVFHDIKNLVRLDMSEYSEGFTMSKLIGAPAGYIGYKEHANLTDRIKQRPYSVVLFDEIEKAHKDVQNLLLQILEEGEISDATGKKVNFKNTVIIMTSNVGLERFENNGIGFSGSENTKTIELTQDIQKELHQRFRPELINRIDHKCIFSPLTKKVLAEICDKQIKELVDRIEDQGIKLTLSKQVASHVLSHVEPKHGARNIRQHIQKHIETKLAERIMKKDKPRKLHVSLKGKTVSVTKTK